MNTAAERPRKPFPWLWAGIIAFGLFVYWNSGQDAAKFDPAKAERPIVNVTVPEFQAAWTNELAAKERFQANRVRIAGVVESVAVNMTGDAVLHMDSADPSTPMTAHFVASEEPKLAALTKGQKVAVLCGRGDIVLGIPVALDCLLAS